MLSFRGIASSAVSKIDMVNAMRGFTVFGNIWIGTSRGEICLSQDFSVISKRLQFREYRNQQDAAKTFESRFPLTLSSLRDRDENGNLRNSILVCLRRVERLCCLSKEAQSRDMVFPGIILRRLRSRRNSSVAKSSQTDMAMSGMRIDESGNGVLLLFLQREAHRLSALNLRNSRTNSEGDRKTSVRDQRLLLRNAL